MNSALKPVLPGVPQAGGQASPAKANVANANHAVGHPQGAQNSIHTGSNNLAIQNLTHHPPTAPQIPPHAAPSMAPVSANMAQMAQNMSHHGNLSHVTQNSVVPTNTATSPSKSASTTAPLSLVQDKPEKVGPSQPLALTRTPEKKDSESHSNGTVESPKTANIVPNISKSQNPECPKEKQDIKGTPFNSKQSDNANSASSTTQRPEVVNAVEQTECDDQSKLADVNELSEKLPLKTTEPKLVLLTDMASTQDVDNSLSEPANDLDNTGMVLTPPIEQSVIPESSKVEPVLHKDEEKEVPGAELDNVKEDKGKEPKLDKIDEQENSIKVDSLKVDEKPEEKKIEPKSVFKPETKPKSTIKLATVTTPLRKRRPVSPSKTSDGVTPLKKSADGESTPDSKSKRNRTKVQLYQSPTPELAMATKLSASAGRSTPTKPSDDKLIVFYKNEYLAVRNTEGGFYICQALQNVYRATRKIKIRWLSQDKTADPSGETYKPDFYDNTDKECVLTTLSLSRVSGALVLRPAEEARVMSILKRALSAEQGTAVSTGSGDGDPLNLTEEHPDGLDLSLYTDESQLEKKSRKRNSSKSSPRTKQSDTNETAKEVDTPSKKARTTPKRSPKSAQKTKSTPQKQTNNKRKSLGSTPNVAPTSKTATAVTEKPKVTPKTPGKVTPTKVTPSKQGTKQETPNSSRKGRRSGKDVKSSPVVPTPSTSTGKATRTPRKPPSKK